MPLRGSSVARSCIMRWRANLCEHMRYRRASRICRGARHADSLRHARRYRQHAPHQASPRIRSSYWKAAARMAERLARHHPQGAIFANHYDTVANRDIHVRTPCPEIWGQSGGTVDGFVSAVRTGGTLAGVAAGLREWSNDVV